MKTTQNDLFRTMARDFAPSDTCKHSHTAGDFLRVQNDPAKRKTYEAIKLAIKYDGLTPKRMYERADWAGFVADVYLDSILEHTSYQSLSGQLANSISIDQGLSFVYREFEHYQRAQRGSENTEFERTKGRRRLQEVPIHTLGLRSYVTEEETLDLPFSSMQLELSTMGSAMGLERDMLWVDSLYKATSGQNAITFNNQLTAKDDLDLEGLHGVLTWFRQPFDADLSTIKLTNPFTNASTANQVEGWMRLGKFKPTDVILNSKAYFHIVNNSFLQQQNIWTNSQILDTGELRVPLLGVNLHKANIGFFGDADDPDSWADTDCIYVVDRNMGGAGTIGSRQPLQVRNWPKPEFRTEDFMIYERLGFAVQNRRALVRIGEAGGSNPSA